MDDVRFEELTTEAEWEAAFPVLMELWEDAPRAFTHESFLDFLEELRDVEGYRLFGAFGDGSLVAVAGVSVRMSAWHGRYLWVYDLVTAPAHRSEGYGRAFLSFLRKWARGRDCETLALASGVHREDAHRFYETEGMERTNYVFETSLEQ